MSALYKGFVVSALASLAILHPVTDFVLGLENTYDLNNKSFSGMDLYYCGVIGLINYRIVNLGYRILYRYKL